MGRVVRKTERITIFPVGPGQDPATGNFHALMNLRSFLRTFFCLTKAGTSLVQMALSIQFLTATRRCRLGLQAGCQRLDFRIKGTPAFLQTVETDGARIKR